MSFILDALKKSEQERARHEQPVTLELPRGKQRRVTPVWMVVVLLLLLVNCGLLVVMMQRKHESPEVAVRTTAPVAVTNKISAPMLNKPMRSLEEEAGMATPPAEEDVAVDDLPAAKTDSAHLPATVTANTGPRMVSASPGSVSTSNTLESLGGSVALGLPALKLDLHVYAQEPAQRFVFINGKRYHEGEVMAEGPTVEAINTQGAVLAWRGQSFLLPR